MPHIYLPVERLNKCQGCGQEKEMHLCSRCGEAAYCSGECQKRDWQNHKPTCTTSDRIDLTSFYPVLACIAESTRMGIKLPHIALRYMITNAPNPGTPAEHLSDGSYARVVRLGGPVNFAKMVPDQSNWWPKGITANVRGKLGRRIMREGNVLPIVVGTCVAMMLKIYSSPSDTVPTPTCLRYRSFGLADFGVVSGKARITPDDQLVYVLPNKTILHGQDPNEHYWIYFTTQKGEKLYFDSNLFTFNMCLGFQPDAYIPSQFVQYFPPLVPAILWDRNLRKGVKSTDSLLTEVTRFSFLRDDRGS
ncbi:hypothetical protein M422DRAFT_223562 [Sphaerobolus stellatus SS14]|nr:hypothetical protein M422DRAFT_223562 [Sphaerobolus stellatus SS14]